MKDTNVTYTYTLKQAIEDGVLVEVFKNSWNELSGGKPIVATSHLFEEVPCRTHGNMERVCCVAHNGYADTN